MKKIIFFTFLMLIPIIGYAGGFWGGGGGGGDGSDTTAIHVDTASEISAITNKVTPANGDFLVIEDSADSNNKKHVLISSLPAGGTDLSGTQVDDTITCGDGTDTVQACNASILVPQDISLTEATPLIAGSDDATQGADLTLQAGNTTGGSNDGGNLILVGGTSAGGTAGAIEPQSNILPTHETYDLGSNTARFKQAWINNMLMYYPGDASKFMNLYVPSNGNSIINSNVGSLDLRVTNNSKLVLGAQASFYGTIYAIGAFNIGNGGGGDFDNIYADIMFEVDDSTQLTAGLLAQPDEATADASAATNLTLQAGNKTAGTGVGGNAIIVAGASAGGAGGNVTLTGGEATAGSGDGGNVLLSGGASAGGTIGQVIIQPDGTNDAITADDAENVTLGAGGLAQAATDGFAYIPTCADAPSGTPTAKTGFVAMCYDITNEDLCIYNGGWNCVSLN